MLDAAKKFLSKIQLKNKQKALNRKYEREGLSDEVFIEQVEINKMRNELDIPDESKFVYDNFVQ